MNFYKFVKDFKAFYDDAIKGANEMAQKDPEFAKMWSGRFECLEPLVNQIDSFSLKDSLFLNFESSNNRIDIFKTSKNRLYYAAYSDQTASSDEEIHNSHYKLASYIRTRIAMDDETLDYDKRWCGFYSRLMGNDTDILVLYGQSSDYPHNQYAGEVAEEFAKEYFSRKSPFLAKTIYVIGHEVKIYTKESFEHKEDELPF